MAKTTRGKTLFQTGPGRGSLLKEALKGAAIVAAAATVGLAVNAMRSEPLPFIQDWQETLNSRRAQELTEQGLAGLDTRQMAQLYRGKDVVVLDARPRDFYLIERIPGARNLPLEEADQLIPGLLKGLPLGTRLITYCESALCPSARKLARKLVQAGHQHVAVYPGGLEEWMGRGMPVAGRQ